MLAVSAAAMTTTTAMESAAGAATVKSASPAYPGSAAKSATGRTT